MLSLQELADLYNKYSHLSHIPVRPIVIGRAEFTSEAGPIIMGTVNLSRDSTYRESIAINTETAVKKSRIAFAQGAALIDIGAESSTAKASRVSALDQAKTLVPIIEQLTELNIPVSIETYEPEVAKAGLQAGARVVNFTGAEHEKEIFELVAATDSSIILCYVGGTNVREITDLTIDVDPIPQLLEYFGKRVETATSCGVTNIILDPGMGFYYGNLVDPMVRVRHQTNVILNSFRLRELGLPICQALPHAFDLFGDEFRTAEGFFAVLAQLGGVNLMRTHEVARVHASVSAMRSI